MRDWIDLLLMEPYPKNTKPLRLIHIINLMLLFLPPGLLLLIILFFKIIMIGDFQVSILSATQTHFLIHIIEKNAILILAFIASGTIATIGGIFDWLFHRTYFTVSRAEHRAHFYALFCGSVIFILMIMATFTKLRQTTLLPLLLMTILTAVLISYDEFIFHKKRCRSIETLFHRMLVIGNGTSFAIWYYIIYYCFD